jgi:hypothetical protein
MMADLLAGSPAHHDFFKEFAGPIATILASMTGQG